MSYFALPFVPALGLNGLISSGAKLYFYLPGTANTLATVYADPDLETPLTNPVVANDNGRFVDIFLDDSLRYRIRLETSAGALIDEVAVFGGCESSGQGFDPQIYIDGGMSHIAALQRAFDEADAAETGKIVRITTTITLAYAAYTEVIQWPANVTLIWDGGEIVYSTFGLPALYNLSSFGYLRSVGQMRFRWDGTIPTGAAPTISSDFVAKLYDDGLTGNFNNCRDNVGALLFCGSRFEHHGTASFQASDFSNVNKAMPLGIAALQGIGGTRGRLDIFGKVFFDGLLMGLQAFNMQRVALHAGGYSARWGQLNLTTYSHSLPGHVFYVAPDVQDTDEVIIGDFEDNGDAMTGTDYSWGSASYKCTKMVKTVTWGRMVSSRFAGLANLHCQAGTVAELNWRGSAAAWSNYSANRALTLGATDTGTDQAQKLSVGGVFLYTPSDDQGSIALAGNNIRIESGLYKSDALAAALSNIWSVYGDNHYMKMEADLPNIAYNSFTVFATFQTGAANNRFDILWNGPDWNNARFLENGGVADVGNTIIVTHKPSGSKRRISDNMESFEVFDAKTVTLTGASVTVTSSLFNGAAMVPNRARVLGVTSRIKTLITGATGYQLGDGTTPALYADKTATAVGTQTAEADFATTVPLRSTAAHNIVITAKTSNFTAGELQIVAHLAWDIAGVYNF